MKGSRNEEGGGDGELGLPHKTKIMFDRKPLQLKWPEGSDTLPE